MCPVRSVTYVSGRSVLLCIQLFESTAKTTSSPTPAVTSWAISAKSLLKSRSSSSYRKSSYGFQRQRNSLAATDAECDDAPFYAIAFHRMQQTGREHRAGRADGV